MQIGPCIPVGVQLEKAAVGPTSGPTRHLSHFGLGERLARGGLQLAAACVDIRGRAVIRHINLF